MTRRPDLVCRRERVGWSEDKKTGAHSPEFAPVLSSPLLRESLAAHLPLAGRLKRKKSHAGPISNQGSGLHPQSALRGAVLQ